MRMPQRLGDVFNISGAVSMRRRISVAALCVAMLGLVLLQPASTGQAADAQTRSLVLALFDQINRIAVAEGSINTATADARLRTRSGEMRAASDADLARTKTEHTQAVTRWRNNLATRVRQGAQWPSGGAESWRPMAEEMLMRVGSE